MANKCKACEAMPTAILAPQVCPSHRLGLVGAGGLRWTEWASCKFPDRRVVSVLLGPFEGEVGRCWLAYLGGGAFGMHREVLASRTYFEFCLQHVQEFKDVSEALTVAAGDGKLETPGDLVRVVEAVHGVAPAAAWKALERWAAMRREAQAAHGTKATPSKLGVLCHQLDDQLAGWRPTPEDLVETAREVVFGAADGAG